MLKALLAVAGFIIVSLVALFLWLRRQGNRFGDDAYAAEELCAEMSAAALCCHLDIINSPRPDHAQYVAHWLKILKADNRAIFTAAAHASRAVEYLFSLQPAAIPMRTGGVFASGVENRATIEELQS